MNPIFAALIIGWVGPAPIDLSNYSGNITLTGATAQVKLNGTGVNKFDFGTSVGYGSGLFWETGPSITWDGTDAGLEINGIALTSKPSIRLYGVGGTNVTGVQIDSSADVGGSGYILEMKSGGSTYASVSGRGRGQFGQDIASPTYATTLSSHGTSNVMAGYFANNTNSTGQDSVYIRGGGSGTSSSFALEVADISNSVWWTLRGDKAMEFNSATPTIVFHNGASAGDLTWKDNGGNTMGTLSDNGTSGILTVAVIKTGSSGLLQSDTYRPNTDAANIVFQESGGITGLTLVDDGVFQGEAWTPATLTIADNGNGGTAATSTALPIGGIEEVTCSDAQGCDWTPTESGATNGKIVRIFNVGSNTLNLKNTAGQVLLSAGNDDALGANDSVSLIYSTTQSAWVELAASNN